MKSRTIWLAWASAILTGCMAVSLMADEKIERFDRDPGWDGRNNRVATPKKRTVKQDFGYSKTAHAGGQPGEIGGFISSAAEPAYYAKRLPNKSLADTLSASGKLLCSGRKFHALLGFFNSGTLNEWRTANSITIRLQGRGDIFYAYVEYATSKWRAGGDSPGGFATIRDPKTGRSRPRGFHIGEVYNWKLTYDPAGNKGNGAITVTIGTETSVCNLSPEHKSDGAAFDHFGLFPALKSADGGGEIWLDDVAINGERDDFSRDPRWDGKDNRRTYETTDIRPQFDFGYSPTHFAGGAAAGELGGLTFRGDCRYPARLACYGDRLETLTMDKPLKASGKIALRRGVTDSTTLLGFYHSDDSMTVNPSQSSGWPRSFLGIAVEGPSREGFFVYPAYRVRGDGQGNAKGKDLPHILPDGKSHDWSLVYDPTAASGRGQIVVTLDGKPVRLDLSAGHRQTGAKFNRFGLITTWIDGNGQRIYFDDLRYTFKQ